ncbi:MAG: hypothetical protein Ct9H300mP7_3620 [Verrucomicrobiota bacterium]|nr:MAG: hypothetical protein Ct9H300mP7_3620 [Verrucomicrobiota bacterium]
MQMIPELTIAMLPVPIGAVHSLCLVRSAPTASSPDQRLPVKAIITQDTGSRHQARHPDESNADKAVESTPSIEKILVVKRTGSEFDEEVATCGGTSPRGRRACLPRRADGRRGSAVHPLHLRQHRQAEGRAHTTGGYLVYVATTIITFSTTTPGCYWCTADIGWVTGHSYIVYGPWPIAPSR